MKAVCLNTPLKNGFIEKLERKFAYSRQNKATNGLAALEEVLKAVESDSSAKVGKCYVIPRINYGAGIGHQLSCWAAALNMSNHYGIGFINPHIWINGGHQEADDFVVAKAYGLIPGKRSSCVWDKLLGVIDAGVELSSIKLSEYALIRLPKFDSDDDACMKQLDRIVEVCRNRNIIIQLAIDQAFEGWPSVSFLKDSFWNSSIRKDDKLCYSNDYYNVAIHIRRGDVTSQMTDRYKSNSYYVNAINSIRENLEGKTSKPIRFNVISEGNKEDFPEFDSLEDIEFLVTMDSKQSFLHVVYADACLISPSGFAAIAAAISNGIKYSPCEYKVFAGEVEWNYLNENGEIILK